MALKNNYYVEIFEKEDKWIKQINSNLLNVVYCNLELRPFYMNKANEIKAEYDKTNNEILGQVLLLITNIIQKIDILNSQYRNFQDVDLNTLLPLFLTNQMSNTNEKDNTENKKATLR